MYDPISPENTALSTGRTMPPCPPFSRLSALTRRPNGRPSRCWEPTASPGMQQGVPISGYYVVKKDCEHPEAVIKLLNFWYREFYQSPDMERYQKMVNDGGEYTSIYSSTPIQSLHPFANLDSALAAKEAF